MRISKIFDKIKGKKVIIVGDAMIDSYTLGRIERKSPEAPVPIINVEKEKIKLGGAANVALNIKSIGLEPVLCTVIGQDSEGQDFIRLCKKNNLNTNGIITDSSRKTTNKNRVIVDDKHIVRIDNENTHNIDKKLRDEFLEIINKEAKTSEIIIFQDYDKGTLDRHIINEIIKENKHSFISVDPKNRNFFNYKNIDLFKPNLNEILEAFNSVDSSEKNLEKISKELSTKSKINNIMITLSEKGLMIQNDKENFISKTTIKEIIDVSGAGDTVISLATILFYLKLPEKFIGEMCNLAGGITCMKSGVNSIDLKELLKNAEINNLDIYL
ncbi:MAG: D-glycero-beta-D-manno-heptose-7-phosphate kinase [Rhodothermaeota bacterium MED-G19]|nr:MAG: D-glycero-beta-D-manno-heptose-7-phosphate kinase [Rhodothermaeota bacterium MED-G19]